MLMKSPLRYDSLLSLQIFRSNLLFHNRLFTLASDINDVISRFTLTEVRAKNINTHRVIKTSGITWFTFIYICQVEKMLNQDQQPAHDENWYSLKKRFGVSILIPRSSFYSLPDGETQKPGRGLLSDVTNVSFHAPC